MLQESHYYLLIYFPSFSLQNFHLFITYDRFKLPFLNVIFS